jgi:hypothetical protein
MVLSEARLASKPKRIIGGIVVASCIVVMVSVAAGNILVPGMTIVLGIAAFTWLILSMTVSIDVDSENVVIRCKPFYGRKISLSDVIAAMPASETTMTEGYGVRALGDKTWGVLVGGPAVALQTSTRRWIVSADRPNAVASQINAHIARN